MTKTTIGLSIALAALAGCGGSSPTTKKEMTAMAKSAPPPPDVKPGGQVVARKVSREAKQDFADAVKFWSEQAKDGWTTSECAAAAGKFLDVASEHDKMIEAYFNAGVSYQMCGDMKQAEEQYRKALKVNPSHGASLANLGEIYHRGGNTTVAMEYYQNAIKADASIASARNNLAWLLYEKLRKSPGDKAIETEALGHLQRVLAVDNDNVVAYTIMALIYMEGSDKNKNRLDVAKLLLETGAKKDDRYAPLYNAQGLLALRRANNVAGALENFRKAVDLDAKFIEARMNLAQIVLSFRKYDEAAALFQQVLALSPATDVKYEATVGLGVALRGMGSVLRSRGDIAGSDAKINEALEKYNEAAKIDGKRGDAYFNIGLLYKDYRTNGEPAQNMKAYQEAKKYFQDFLAKNDGEKDKIAEAKDHIEDCDKYVKILQQVIDAQKEAPPPPPAAPTPAPAGGGTTGGTGAPQK